VRFLGDLAQKSAFCTSYIYWKMGFNASGEWPNTMEVYRGYYLNLSPLWLFYCISCH
jgi:hypothetical protein